MASYQVKLTDNAIKDLEVIYQHYFVRVNDQLANKLLAEIDEAIDTLAQQPLLGHLPKELASTGADYLELLTKSFRLIYQVDNTSVFVMMILHQMQSVAKAASARSLH